MRCGVDGVAIDVDMLDWRIGHHTTRIGLQQANQFAEMPWQNEIVGADQRKIPPDAAAHRQVPVVHRAHVDSVPDITHTRIICISPHDLLRIVAGTVIQHQYFEVGEILPQNTVQTDRQKPSVIVCGDCNGQKRRRRGGR
jgi:hypothetical protein